MWETIRAWLQSPEIWETILTLIVGAVIGGIIGVRYSLSASRPKLIINGRSGGGGPDRSTWNITIRNRPSFFGQVLDGETARDVRAYIRLNQPRAQNYVVFWWGPGPGQRDHQTTIEPGQQQQLQVFHWQRGTDGYFIVDHNGEPVAKFQGRERRFVLLLLDRLDRRTEIKFIVEFDDTHLQNSPQLRVITPPTMRDRLERMRDGIREFLTAFRSR
jgi:hypothetical protein